MKEVNVSFWISASLTFLIEFVGVTLVNKIIQVSGAQFYNTSSVHCTVCSPLPPHPKSSLCPSPFSAPHLPPTPCFASPGKCHTAVHNPGFFLYFLLNPSITPTQPTPWTAVSLIFIYNCCYYVFEVSEPRFSSHCSNYNRHYIRYLHSIKFSNITP